MPIPLSAICYGHLIQFIKQYWADYPPHPPAQVGKQKTLRNRIRGSSIINIILRDIRVYDVCKKILKYHFVLKRAYARTQSHFLGSGNSKMIKSINHREIKQIHAHKRTHTPKLIFKFYYL